MSDGAVDRPQPCKRPLCSVGGYSRPNDTTFVRLSTVKATARYKPNRHGEWPPLKVRWKLTESQGAEASVSTMADTLRPAKVKLTFGWAALRDLPARQAPSKSASAIALLSSATNRCTSHPGRRRTTTATTIPDPCRGDLLYSGRPYRLFRAVRKDVKGGHFDEPVVYLYRRSRKSGAVRRL